MSDSVLQATDLCRHYHISRGMLRPADNVIALNGVSFTLQAGRTLAVVGESGCGKSTLARQLTLIERPTSGSLKIAGVDVTDGTKATVRLARTRIQMVFQNPYGSLNPRKTVRYLLDEPLAINTSLSGKERDERVSGMLAQVGLRPEMANRYPHMFSGGQRQRIAIARAMMLKPSIIVADEPTSALDVSIQAQILNLFMDLQDATGVAYVFISHNLSVVEHIANDLMVMYLGRAVEQGDKTTVFDRPRHPYTQALLSSTPSLDPTRRRKKIEIHGELPSPLDPPPGCTFHRRCPFATELCRTIEPQLRPFDGRLIACHLVESLSV
jgi:dipeptide transport system ATP-binding protein